MIISPAKVEDMKWRLQLVSEMETDLRLGRVITAREIGKTTAWLAKRIQTHDYKREDAILNRYPHSPIA